MSDEATYPEELDACLERIEGTLTQLALDQLEPSPLMLTALVALTQRARRFARLVHR